MIKTSDIVNKVFSKAFMGYDVREVDAFLDDIIDELERVTAERREMANVLESLMGEVERLGGASIPAAKAAELAGGSAQGLQPPERRSIGSPATRRVQTVRIGAAQKNGQDASPQPVALEMETGAAAPRRKAAEAELKRAGAMQEPSPAAAPPESEAESR